MRLLNLHPHRHALTSCLSFFSLLSLLTYPVLTTAQSTPTPPITGHAFTRFITIWLENQDLSTTIANPHIQALLPQAISLTNYYGLTHPSQPNYMASLAGDYFGLNHDGFVRVPWNVSTLVDLLEEREEGPISWAAYMECLPGPGYMGQGASEQELVAGDGSERWDYVRKHNPFVSFDSVTRDGSRLLKIRSFDAFQRDLAAENLPQYMFLTPDMLNDGHNTSLDFAAAWSEQFLEPLLANEYFMKDTLILLTYDESETYTKPNQIVSLLLGGAVPDTLKGTEDDTFYTHYSIISTLQNNWDLHHLGRFDVGANVFQYVADKTGFGNTPLTDDAKTMVDLSISYQGFLNSDEKMYWPIPAPNQKLTGAGGKGILPMVANEWAVQAESDTPYDGAGRIWSFLELRPPQAIPVG